MMGEMLPLLAQYVLFAPIYYQQSERKSEHVAPFFLKQAHLIEIFSYIQLYDSNNM